MIFEKLNLMNLINAGLSLSAASKYLAKKIILKKAQFIICIKF